MLLLAGCASPEADAVLAFARHDDGSYAVEPVEVPALTDPFTMTGDLGSVAYGGRMDGTEPGLTWTGGRPLWIDADVQDGVAIPPDEDGLLLYSFYAHLAGAEAAMGAQGVDTTALFPVDMAFNPAVWALLELQPVDNAAYMTGNHLFVLLPDGNDREVPVLANGGVVLHESGHALFHLLTSGDPLAAPIVADPTSADGLWLASLHEAFADLFAALVLDDPRFLEPSLPMESRWMDGDASLDAVASMPEDLAGDPTATLLYDPYAIGTVLASVAWDVRLATDDPAGTLAGVLAGTSGWDRARVSGAGWLDAWLTAADEGTAEALCASVAVRAPELDVACP